MAELVHNTDRESTAKNLLIDIFQNKYDFCRLLATYTAEAQEIEDALWDLLNGFWVSTAIGVQLDAVGEFVGVAREGSTDERYRLRIRARIKINLSSGTIEQLLEIARLLMPVGAALKYTPYYPAAFEIDGTGDALTSEEAEETGAAVIEATAAGVQVNFIYGESPRANLFRFSASSSSEAGATTKGFSDLSQITGGKFSGVISSV